VAVVREAPSEPEEVQAQLSVRPAVASARLWERPAEALHEAVRAEAEERLWVRREVVVQPGAQAARVALSALRPEVVEQLSVVREERPLAAPSVRPSDLQEPAQRLAQQ
jgi:hypothetical protein